MVTARRSRKATIAEEERAVLAAKLLIAESQRAALHDALSAVLDTIPQEFATAEVQAVRREARALLVEVGR